MKNFSIKEITPDIYVLAWDKTFYHTNATIIMTPKGPIIIDTFRDKHQFAIILDFIKSKGCKTINTIIYTHWHVDHTGGNRCISDCNIIAHRTLADHFDEFNKNHIDRLKQKGIIEQDLELIYPNMLVDEFISLDISGRKISIYHCPGHSFDSIIIFDDATKTLIAGDNLVNREEPFMLPPAIPPDAADITPEHFKAAFKQLEKLNADIIIPGHGSIVNPKELIEFNKYRYYKCINEGLDFIE
ncbi:MAG: MBL fold metallo-hydrolase [Bacillota bacterium]